MLLKIFDRLFQSFISVEASAPATAIRVFKMTNTLIPATARAAFIVEGGLKLARGATEPHQGENEEKQCGDKQHRRDEQNARKIQCLSLPAVKLS